MKMMQEASKRRCNKIKFVSLLSKNVLHPSNAQVVPDLQTGCNKSVHKLLASCVHTACSKLLKQVGTKLLTTCNKHVGLATQGCESSVLSLLRQVVRTTL